MKLWLIGVTTEGHKQDLKELIEPIKQYFDGLIWTFHYPKDEGADYLESIKGGGEIIYTKWCNRLDFSRNHSLYQGPMRIGDWFVTLDTLERLSPDFAVHLKRIANRLDQDGIDGSFLYNKRFMFKLKENTAFVNNPHEGLSGAAKTIELTKTDLWRDDFIKNVRGKKRQDEFHFLKHNFKYYLFPNTNHLLLGFEDDLELVKTRYKVREQFFREIYKLGFYPYDIESVKNCLKGDLTPTLKSCINFDKFLNDWYRYDILGQRKGLLDKHDFSVFKPINF
tara:strand:+ start:1970 stop:2809 length:840 start_codon:yes stop_codon:yes gene_type:complete